MRKFFQRGVFIGLVCAGAAVAAPCAFASAILPPMKPGFWKQSMVMTMDMAGQPPDNDKTPDVTFSCMSLQMMHDDMAKMSGALPGCNFDLEGSGGNYTITTNCKDLGGQPGTLVGTGTMTFIGDSAMHVAETTTVTSAAMNAKMDMSGDAKWVGQCPSGVAPGDFGTMVNGTFQKTGNFADMGKMPTGPAN
jgi:hypothetical protein